MKTIFLDRDDTIIEDRIYLNDPTDIVYFNDAFTALKEMQERGYQLIIVTNQSGIPRGLVQIENLKKIHDIIFNDFQKHGVEITGFYYAPHLPESNHHLRKPNIGMLELADQEHGVDFKNSWIIGDRMTDVEAGHRAGCKTILLGNKESPAKSEFDPPEFHVQTLTECLEYIR